MISVSWCVFGGLSIPYFRCAVDPPKWRFLKLTATVVNMKSVSLNVYGTMLHGTSPSSDSFSPLEKVAR